MGHDVPAQIAARVGEPIGEFSGLGEQQQAHDVVDERRKDDELGLDRVVGAVRPVIRHAGDAPAVVAVHVVAHGAGDELEVAGGVGFGDLGHQGRRLRPHMAAVRRAEAAIAAARPPLVGLRDDGARRRERVIAELLGAFLENERRIVDQERRQRELALPRRLEDVAARDLAALQVAGFAGNAEIVFGAVVIRLEIVVAQWPVGDRAVLRDGGCAVALDRLRAGAKIVVMEAPRHRAVMDRAAADLGAVVERRQRHRARAGIGPPGDGLALGVGAQLLALEITQLVLAGEVRGGVTRTALEADRPSCPPCRARLRELRRWPRYPR